MSLISVPTPTVLIYKRSFLPRDGQKQIGCLGSGSGDNSICLWDVKTGQQKAKLDGHEHYVMSVCFSPDGNTLVSGSYDNSIRLLQVKTGQQISLKDNRYYQLLAQQQPLLFSNTPIQLNQFLHNFLMKTNITILLLSQQPIFQAQGALILKGEFINQSGIDLKTLFKQKGSCFLENLKQK